MLSLNLIGNMNVHLKTLKMQTVWEQKKASGDVTSKRDPVVESWQRVVDEMHGKGENGGVDRVKLRDIHAKLEAGGKLTMEERDFLQANDPQAYQDLVQEEREQRAYEQALRRCRTKEDVERLKLNQVNKSMTVLKSVEHNPQIPLQKKLEIAMAEQRKLNRVAESTQKFVESGEYAQLPTDAEYMEAMKESAEDKRPVPEQDVEQSKGSEAPKDDAAQSGEGRPQAPADTQDAEKPRPVEPQKAEKPKPAPSEAPKLDLETEAQRKVNRARAKAAYAPPPQDPGTSWSVRG